MTQRALIVIDVQNEYAPGGGLPITYPPFDQSSANIGRAIAAARTARIPVVVIAHDAPAESPVFAVHSPTWANHTVVADVDDVIHKRLPGAFTGTTLGEWLADRDVDTVSIVGYMTNVCVDTTARQAAHAGLSVEVLADATGTLDYSNSAGEASAEQIHNAVLATLHAVIGAVATTDEWIGALDGGPLEGSNLVASTRR